MGNRDFFLPEQPPIGANGTAPVREDAILRLAHATIGLSRVAPRLSELATVRQMEAERQAEHARNVARMAREMTATLEQTVRQLRLSTGEIGELTSLIRCIADQTRLIAINTRIAAARAGEQGRVFTVLADEIRSLSESTAAATRDVQGKVGRLRENALRTALTVGLEDKRGPGEEGRNGLGLGWLLDRMDEADASASRQASEARELSALGKSLRELSEQMIRSVGAFRLDAHNRVEQLIEELRADPGLRSADPARQARALQLAVNRCPFVELAYATDARGIQTTENISRKEFAAAYGATGHHKNWSRRPWFLGALRTAAVHLSDIYRSEATDEFCLTASATFNGDNGRVLGVVALDVNFRDILGNDRC